MKSCTIERKENKKAELNKKRVKFINWGKRLEKGADVVYNGVKW